MTHLEKAIRDAVKGGWQPVLYWEDYTGVFRCEGTGVVFDFVGTLDSEEKYMSQIHITWGDVFMSPAFWSALGKARGWTTKFEVLSGISEEGVEHSLSGGEMEKWQYEWHRFIEHLVSGGDVESYFESISTNK